MPDTAYEANVAFIEAVERLQTNATKPVTDEHLKTLAEDIRRTRTTFTYLLRALGKMPDRVVGDGVVYLD